MIRLLLGIGLLVLAWPSLARCSAQGSDIEVFFRETTSGLEDRPATFDAIVGWREDREREFARILSFDPVGMSNEFCKQFASAAPADAFSLSLSGSKYFLHALRPIPVEVWNDEDRLVEKFRRTQVEWFIRNREFRDRYMKLCVWETRALWHHLTSEQFRGNPVLECTDLERSIDNLFGLVREESPVIGEIPNTLCLQLLFLIALTSREDLLTSKTEGDIFMTYTQWHDWFKNNKTRLIQRNDMIGWSVIPAGEMRRPESPGAGIAFPFLAIPDLAIGDLVIRKAELRRNFSYEVR